MTFSEFQESPKKEQLNQEPEFDIKFDALDSNSQIKYPQAHYFIKKLIGNESRKLQPPKKTKNLSQVTKHKVYDETKIDHQKLLQHYCEYLLPDIQRKPTLLTSSQSANESDVVFDFAT